MHTESAHVASRMRLREGITYCSRQPQAEGSEDYVCAAALRVAWFDNASSASLSAAMRNDHGFGNGFRAERDRDNSRFDGIAGLVVC